jgi:hypothetical protein
VKSELTDTDYDALFAVMQADLSSGSTRLDRKSAFVKC